MTKRCSTNKRIKKMMHSRSSLSLNLVLFLLFHAAHPGLSQPRGLKHDFRLMIDTAVFKSDSLDPRLEIYLGVDRSSLEFQRRESLFHAGFTIEAQLLRGDSVVYRSTIAQADSVSELTDLKPGQQYIFARSAVLTPGKYDLVVDLRDEITGTVTQKRRPIGVAPISNDSLTFSSVQLASAIQKATGTDDAFEKNNLRIIPNPRRLYGSGSLVFFAELYNLFVVRGSMGTYQVNYLIENQQGELLQHYLGQARSKTGDVLPLYASLDISGLPTGIYTLRLYAVDHDSELEAKAAKSFMVYREAPAPSQEKEREQNIYANFDGASLQAYFNKIAYIASDEEKTLFQQLELPGKQNFLVEFWRKRDPTPGTPQNELKDDYLQRVVQAETSFGHTNVEGWKTDRGRILLTYGLPNDIQREPDLADRNAYETWTYNELEGGAIFIFVDVNRNGDLRLVHSTYRNEVQDADWQSYLSR